MTYEIAIAEAKSDALQWAADARNRVGGQPPSAEDTHREAARALGSPGAAVAVATLATTGWAAVPLGDDQQPVGDPLPSYAAIHAHYRNRHHDGAGIELGAKPAATLVAVHGTAKAWSDWYAEAAVESSKARYEDGSGKLTTYRDAGRFSSISWQPPASPLRSTGVAVGAAELNAAAERMRPRHLGANERGWLLWAVPVDGRSLTFRDRKLGPDLAVVGQGVVPLHAVRADGWRATVSGLPVIEPMPDWLLVELGGRLGKPRAAA